MPPILDQSCAAEEAARDNHRQETLVEAQCDVDRRFLDWERIGRDSIYREALIGYLMNLASPVIDQQNINQCFAFGWADEI